MISREKLQELLHYDPETGWFTWRVKRNAHGGAKQPGDRAGYKAPTGYRFINTQGRPYKEHRLAWLYVHGEWPSGEIDHANRNPGDNRLVNLRVATRSQNAANMVGARRAASGFKGVYKHKNGQSWFSQISVASRSKFLGRFPTPEEAHAAYVAAAREHYGEFARIS